GGAAAGQLGDLRVVRGVVRVGDGAGEDRRVGRDADHVAGRDQLREVPGGDAGPGQVVQPDADAGGGELGGGGAHAFSLRVSRAASTTASAVMPNFWNRVL